MLLIGLNGLVGSGKDTVAKMMSIILNHTWNDKEDARAYYKNYFEKHRYATLTSENEQYCMCIAFADQLKKICSVIFGIPVERFYWNKENSWICINKGFRYTEMTPPANSIITADDFYTSKDVYMHSDTDYYMSLREILVYIGTYVCQADINKSIFVNIVNNIINDKISKNKDLKYVICTDVRFMHEYEYILNNNGIMIDIIRDNVTALDNIAEHELDMLDPDNYDYTIYNEGVSYDDLFDNVWDLIHNNPEFNNNIIGLDTRDGSNNYLRKIVDNSDGTTIYKLCTEDGIVHIQHTDDDKIALVDPAGGPVIEVDNYIENTDLLVKDIEYNEFLAKYFIAIEEKQ